MNDSIKHISSDGIKNDAPQGIILDSEDGFLDPVSGFTICAEDDGDQRDWFIAIPNDGYIPGDRSTSSHHMRGSFYTFDEALAWARVIASGGANMDSQHILVHPDQQKLLYELIANSGIESLQDLARIVK